MPARAVIGLGNPGSQYRYTRHNIGFIVLDYIIHDQKISFRPGKGDFYFCRYLQGEDSLLLIKPTTYMNMSGKAVEEAMEQFLLDQENILIVYDDFHLPLGTIRFRAKGSDGGHNGIRSIIERLETRTFDRLKIGIGSTMDDPVKYVLTTFKSAEWQRIINMLPHIKQGILTWFNNGITEAMNGYNRNFIEIDDNGE